MIFVDELRDAGLKPPRRSAEHGFTLVEVMIALFIFGMIAAAGVALLSFSVRAQAATSARLDQVASIARLSSALSADLAQAMDRPARDDRGTLRPAFVGESGGNSGRDFLHFTRGGWSNLDGEARSGLQKVAWRFHDGVIERQGWAMLDGAAPLPAATMLDHVRAVALRYRVDGAWSDRWDGAANVPLPQAVELNVVRDDGVEIRELFYIRAPYRVTQVPPGA